jgi:hypothetical protein
VDTYLEEKESGGLVEKYHLENDDFPAKIWVKRPGNASQWRLLFLTLWQDQAGADESNRMAANWVKQNLAPLLPNPPEITAGEVMTSKVS